MGDKDGKKLETTKILLESQKVTKLTLLDKYGNIFVLINGKLVNKKELTNNNNTNTNVNTTINNTVDTSNTNTKHNCKK